VIVVGTAFATGGAGPSERPAARRDPAGRVRIGILGPVELVAGGPARLGGVKERCLLAALAVHCGEAVSAAALVDALWGDHPPRTAAKTLQNYVLRVRRALGSTGGGDLGIVTLPAGYCLRAVPGMVDAGLAESLIAAGRRGMAGGDPAAAARLLRQALDLWRGPALAEFAGRPFAAAEALRLEELREAALEDLFDAELALGRHHEVAGSLEALVTSGPLRERRWGQLMMALYRDGRQAEALDAFHRLRRLLTQELGVDPGAELRQLHQAILRQSPALAWQPRRQTQETAGRGYFGRAPEMARLLGRLAETAAGRGGVVLLAGEPGIGKSHALQQLAAAARASSATVLTGRCVEGTWVPPWRPFAEAITGYGESVGPEQLAADLGPAAAVLARITPRLPELLPDLTPPPALQPDAERFRLLDAAAQFFTALSGHAAVLLILDDLHWADAGTAMMMRHVARSCAHSRLLIAGAYRTTEMVTEDPLADVLGALQAETECSTIPLRALGSEAVGQLAAAEAGGPVSPSLAAAIAVHTGGNPFFAKEMIRHLLEERALADGGSGVLAKDDSGVLEAPLPLVAVPEGVRQILARRRARLPAEANRLAECASGFAGPFLFPVAAAAAGLDDTAALAALDKLLAAAMIRPGETAERYEFGHALARQAIYDTLSPSRQARLHRQLAHGLEAARARVPACTEPAEIVAQYAGSRALPGAAAGVPAAIEAADLAQAAGAHDTAVAFLTTAAELAGPGDERLITIRARLGLALAWALRFDEAVIAARAAAERVADAEGAPAAADYLAEVTSALSAAGSSAHAWMLAPGGWPSCTGRPGWSRAASTSPGTPSRPSTAAGRTCPPRRRRTRRCCCICWARCVRRCRCSRKRRGGPAPMASWPGRSTAGPASRGRWPRSVTSGAHGRHWPRRSSWPAASRARAGAGSGSMSRVRGTRWRWRRVRTGPACRPCSTSSSAPMTPCCAGPAPPCAPAVPGPRLTWVTVSGRWRCSRCRSRRWDGRRPGP
jgi:DNA-binding SARP family transcriptional activator